MDRNIRNYAAVLMQSPHASAKLKGSAAYPNIHGYAFSIFLTDRFLLSEVLGKTVIIHGNSDDFTTQPSGKAGDKLACGVIRVCKKQCR